MDKDFRNSYTLFFGSISSSFGFVTELVITRNKMSQSWLKSIIHVVNKTIFSKEHEVDMIVVER